MNEHDISVTHTSLGLFPYVCTRDILTMPSVVCGCQQLCSLLELNLAPFPHADYGTTREVLSILSRAHPCIASVMLYC